MQDAFWTVLLVVVIGGGIVAIFTFAVTGRTYDQIGRGGLSLRDGSDRPAHEPPALGSAAALGERDDEIRQMLEARNDRRARRGQAPLDIEAELAALTKAAPVRADPALEAEIRDLVIARNERRERQGKAPLDVEAEVERQLRELGLKAQSLGNLPSMANPRLFELDDLLNRPGTYFNPQTEVLVVVDDSPDLDSEIFNMEEFEGAEWVLISDESPVDEHVRDELIERFQTRHHPGTSGAISANEDDIDEVDEIEPDEDEDELDED